MTESEQIIKIKELEQLAIDLKEENIKLKEELSLLDSIRSVFNCLVREDYRTGGQSDD